MKPKRRFGRRLPESIERRNAERDQLGISVSLLSMGQSRVVLMVDVSQSGAQIKGQNLPGVGEDVLLRIADVELFGSIVRACEGEAAILFDPPTGATELERLREIHDEQTRDLTPYLR